MHKLNRLGYCALILIALSGCASTITDPNQPLVKYTAIGRAALKAPDNSGQAGFNWAQTSTENLRLVLEGPLGSGHVDLIVSPTESILKTDGKTYKDPSPDLLFAQVTGFDWPISGMQSWIVGKPHAEPTLVKRDEHKRIASFKEDGWTIQYKRWKTYKQRDLPESIELTRDDVRLRLLIEHWKY